MVDASENVLNAENEIGACDLTASAAVFANMAYLAKAAALSDGGTATPHSVEYRQPFFTTTPYFLKYRPAQMSAAL
jgi:hypothetical protein